MLPRAAFLQGHATSSELSRTVRTPQDGVGRNALVWRHSRLEKPGELARSLQPTARLCDLTAYLTDSCHDANKIANRFWLLTCSLYDFRHRKAITRKSCYRGVTV